jgi:hypothetical protein
MYSVEADPKKRLFVISGTGNVTAPEVARVRDEVRQLLEGAASEFYVLADFRFITSMKPEVARNIAEIMDLLAEKKVAGVVRVIPNASHDVGMNILSRLHYGRDVEVFTVKTLAEAVVLLAAP